MDAIGVEPITARLQGVLAAEVHARPEKKTKRWWELPELNRRPLGFQASALTV